MFDVMAEVEEFVGTRLVLEARGMDCPRRVLQRARWRRAARSQRLSASRIRSECGYSPTASAQYIRFLPTGDLCEPLADLVFFYNGEQLDWDAELAIPAGAAEPIRIGRFGQLGWTTWMAPNWTSTEAYRRDARFHPAERMQPQTRCRRRQAPQGGGRNGRYQP